jgi:hypothetical protein
MGYHYEECSRCGHSYYESEPHCVTFTISGIDDEEFYLCPECACDCKDDITPDYFKIIMLIHEHKDGTLEEVKSLEEIYKYDSLWLTTVWKMDYKLEFDRAKIRKLITDKKIKKYEKHPESEYNYDALIKRIEYHFECTTPAYKVSGELMRQLIGNCENKTAHFKRLKRCLESICFNIKTL